MLNFSNNEQEAQIHYGAADYVILQSGGYVKCAVTDKNIPLDELRYWSADLQEAYIDASASLKRYLQRISEIKA